MLITGSLNVEEGGRRGHSQIPVKPLLALKMEDSHKTRNGPGEGELLANGKGKEMGSPPPLLLPQSV